MSFRSTLPIVGLFLIAALACGLTWPASAAPGRLKLVRPTTQSTQWPVQINGWWALIDETGNLNTEPELDWIGFTDRGLAAAASRGRFGVIDGVGRWRIEPQYEHLGRFTEGFAVFRRGGKAGFLNVTGKEVLRPELEDARRFRDGLAAIRTTQGCGFIDTSMRVVVPPVLAVARSLHEGLGVVALGRPTPGSSEARTLEQLARRPLNELLDSAALARPPAEAGAPPPLVWGCVDRSGRLVWLDRTEQIEAMSDFGNNLAPVRIDGRWGFINRAFRLTIAPQWDDARPFVRGYAAVKRDGKWGYLNAAGRLIIAPRWDQAFDFDETLALVRRDDLWGYIDVSGRVAISPQFTHAEAFFRGRARVNAGWAQRPDAFGYINVAGQIIFDPREGAVDIVDVRRGGATEITTVTSVGTRNGLGSGFKSRVRKTPPPRPTPRLPVTPDHLYDQGLSIYDPAPLQPPHDYTP